MLSGDHGRRPGGSFIGLSYYVDRCRCGGYWPFCPLSRWRRASRLVGVGRDIWRVAPSAVRTGEVELKATALVEGTVTMVVEKGKVTPPSVERVNITLLLVPPSGCGRSTTLGAMRSPTWPLGGMPARDIRCG